MKIKKEFKVTLMYILAGFFIILGLIIGMDSVGEFFIIMGIIGLIIVTSKLIFKKEEKKPDERMLFIATKALRITFLFLMFVAFLIIIFDRINPITLPYYLFMSYMVCILLLVYFISYKLLLKYN